MTSGRRASLQTVSSYLSSKLCPVPAGDTPTSRRLFDAMAGGCIPILFAPFEDIAPNLPFPSSLDWKRLALFGGGLTCSFVEHRNETIAWLRELLDPAHEPGLDCLRKRVRSAYRRHISLRGHGAVTSLLLELQRSSQHLETQRDANPRAWERPGASASVSRSPDASDPDADADGSRDADDSDSVDDSDSDAWDTGSSASSARTQLEVTQRALAAWKLAAGSVARE